MNLISKNDQLMRDFFNHTIGFDSVFNESVRDPLFTFDEEVNEKEIIFLLKGYELGVDH